MGKSGAAKAGQLASRPAARSAAPKTVPKTLTVSRPTARKAAVPVIAPKLVSRAIQRPAAVPSKRAPLAKAKGVVRGAAPATRLVRVKALDPCARCGPNTSVEQLYRVDEQVAGTATVHLVFFDRHGWYCVHGASCVAVRDVHAELKAQRAGAGHRR